MHIADGILTGPVLIAGFAGTAILAALTMRRMDLEEIPKISVITAVFFIASLIKFPIGPSSVHLILNGLAGVVLGWRAFPAIMLGIILQTVLFGHGGVTVIGVNSIMLGGGALLAYLVWQLRLRFEFPKREVVFGTLAGATGIISSGIVLALALLTAGEAFVATAGYVLAAHVPIMIIEAAVVGACTGFLARVKPEVLAGQTGIRAR
ncbi:MAG: cobalt/nickel transport system permease protein [Gammaproteobacteria bacterium]|nr:MAG: cobalt/nickel transport system permease protein [Gammaproteobacteria bacterium]TND06767.1 MAG: cobalt/nickel transport system permease protein [Gammaproteobacteria bacterium]